MRIFKGFNKNGKCPICGTNEDKETVLIGVTGTEEGNNMQAEQFHLECLDLLYNKELGIIYQKIDSKEDNSTNEEDKSST